MGFESDIGDLVGPPRRRSDDFGGRSGGRLGASFSPEALARLRDGRDLYVRLREEEAKAAKATKAAKAAVCGVAGVTCKLLMDTLEAPRDATHRIACRSEDKGVLKEHDGVYVSVVRSVERGFIRVAILVDGPRRGQVIAVPWDRLVLLNTGEKSKKTFKKMCKAESKRLQLMAESAPRRIGTGPKLRCT